MDSAYLARSISEYPDPEFKQEKDEGYEIFLFRLDYYTRLRPGVQCGRHLTNDADPNFDPAQFIKDHRNVMHMSDYPQKELARFEAKTGFLRRIQEEIFAGWPRFDLNKLTNENSLRYLK